MSILSFNTDGGFPFSLNSKRMVLSSSINQKVHTVGKVGYSFLGWYASELDYDKFIVYKNDGTSWVANSQQITVYYSDGTIWKPHNVPDLIPLFDKEGKAVKSTGYWSDDYPNGVWLNENDVTVIAVWEDAQKQRIFFDKQGNRKKVVILFKKDKDTKRLKRLG